MNEMIMMSVYCAGEAESFTSEIPEVQTVTRKMYEIIARAYAREALVMALENDVKVG